MKKFTWKLALISVTGLSLIVIGAKNIFAETNLITAQANIPSYLNCGVSDNSAILTPDLINIAGVSATTTSNIIFLTTNSNSTGTTNIIISSNGQLSSGPNNIKSQSSGTTTLTIGSDKYGIQASSTNGIITSAYNFWNDLTIGPLATSSQVVAAISAPGTTKIGLRIKATTSPTKPAGNYTDTINLTCLPGI